jgi:hypothetical protein
MPQKLIQIYFNDAIDEDRTAGAELLNQYLEDGWKVIQITSINGAAVPHYEVDRRDNNFTSLRGGNVAGWALVLLEKD